MRGRYACFESTIPYLEMFNSVIKNEEAEEEKLDNILTMYRQNKESAK